MWLRRRALPVTPSSLWRSTARATPYRTLASSPERVEPVSDDAAEAQWRHFMEEKYGEGTHQLFRAIYKDLCDEVRREYFTKPPPPLALNRAQLNSALPPPTDGASVATAAPPGSPSTTDAAAASEPPRETPVRAPSEKPTISPPAGAQDGSWTVEYAPSNNIVTFTRQTTDSSRLARIVAYSVVELCDPPRLNAMLTFADWFPIEVMIERRGVVIHISMASNEGGMHMRNVRVYDAAVLGPQVMETTDDALWVRKHLAYDGPCLWHLELGFQNELYDIMQDHGITLDWIRWAAEWVYYLEHVNYCRWALGTLEELIPSAQRGPEGDFLLPSERAALDEPVGDWLSARAT